jgi:cobalt/nickel transport system permease protein
MGRANYVDRTLARAAVGVRTVLLASDAPDEDGFLQAVSPTVTVVGLVALVTVAATRGDPTGAAAMLALATGLAISSRVSLRTFAVRAAGPPAFSLVVVAPQAVLLNGTAVAGTPLTVPGVTYVTTFVVRVAAAVGLFSLLLLTTRFGDV